MSFMDIYKNTIFYIRSKFPPRIIVTDILLGYGSQKRNEKLQLEKYLLLLAHPKIWAMLFLRCSVLRGCPLSFTAITQTKNPRLKLLLEGSQYRCQSDR